MAEDNPTAGDGDLWLRDRSGWERVHPESALPEFAPEATDRYVTVDERVGSIVGVVAAPWPTVSTTGALGFGDPIVTAWFETQDLQQAVDGFRSAAGQAARLLRIGDTFWVRGFSDELGAWQEVLDVTAFARAAVKGAVATVCLGDVADPDALFEVDPAESMSRPEDTASTPPPAGPSIASPAV